MSRLWIALGAVYGCAAVALAAYAAHGKLAPESLGMLRNAIQIAGWHALALLFVGLWAARGGMPAEAAGAAFAIGIVLFCGAVGAQALADTRLPMVAPIGGSLLMLGWLLLALSALRSG